MQLALHGDEHLDHLEDARRQFGAALELLDLVVEAAFEARQGFVEMALDPFDLGHGLLVLEADLPPLPMAKLGQHGLGDLDIGRHALGAAGRHLAHQLTLEDFIDVALDDDQLIVAVLGEMLDLLVLDRHGAFVLIDAAPREHADFDNRSRYAGRQLQAGVAHVGRLLAEDRPEQLFLRRHRAFALGRNLADQDIAGLDLGADVDNARLVEILEGFLADIGNVPGDLFLTELGVARHDFEFLDMDRSKDVVLDDALGNQDRILEVVTAPRHEGDQHVAAQGQLAGVDARAVGNDLAGVDHIAHLDQGTLVDAGVLIRTLELQQIVDIDAKLTGGILVGTHHDARGVHLIDHPGPARHDAGAGIPGHGLFHAGAHQGRFGADQGNRLALHVRPHQRPVGVVVLQERDQGGGHGNQLLG